MTTPWPRAREVAATSFPALPVREVAVADALRAVLASEVTALTDLPAFDTSAMDGWAVAGPGPWQVTGEVLAGGTPQPLRPGDAVTIATGAPVPPGASAVLRSERGWFDGARLQSDTPLSDRADVRPRGQECRAGDLLLGAGSVLGPAAMGLAAAAGFDRLPVVPRPAVDVLVLGDELLTRGLPSDGRVRDALGPMLPAWLGWLGAVVGRVSGVADTAAALRRAVRASRADVVVTTGSTARGPVDHLHGVLEAAGAQLLVDGVAVRPGHPQLLARLADGRPLVGLPGNPLAAVSGVVTLAAPVLRALRGLPAETLMRVALRHEATGHPDDTRLVPVAVDELGAVPLRFAGPAMLRGLAGADALAVLPPGGGAAGSTVELLPLPARD